MNCSCPAYTATAFYYKKLPPDLQTDLPKALAEAREFAKGEYASALQQGAALPGDERKKIVAELARLTGLKPQVIEDNNLRIDSGLFRKQLLHDEGLILGAYDARITGRDEDPASPYPDFDPSYAATYGPFSAAMNAYVREELKFEDDLPYEIIAGRAAVELRRAQRLSERGRPACVGDESKSVHARVGARRPARFGLPDGHDTLRARAHATGPGLPQQHHYA